MSKKNNDAEIHLLDELCFPNFTVEQCIALASELDSILNAVNAHFGGVCEHTLQYHALAKDLMFLLLEREAKRRQDIELRN